MYKVQVLLRIGAKGKSPILAKRVRSLVNFRSGHELLMFAPKDEEPCIKSGIEKKKKKATELNRRKSIEVNLNFP